MQNTRFRNLYNRVKRKLLANIWVARVVIGLLVIMIVIGVGWVGLKIVKPGVNYVAKQNLTVEKGRTNILILGMRGESSEGPDMTDTMMVASIEKATGQVTLISLPRDLWSDTLKAKINSAYHLGAAKEATTGGILLSKTIVEEISGQPIHYVVAVNFTLFKKFIDAVGGVEIDVPVAFDDYKYPIAGKENDLCGGDPQTLCRYEHLHFDAGKQQMNGETALKYVRSRQSANLNEGSDFARSRRQEQVISALKSKLMLQSPNKYLDLYNLVKSSVITDLEGENFIPLSQLLLKAKTLPIKSFTISEDNILTNPPIEAEYNYQWVLVPKNNDTSLIPNFFKQVLL